MIARTAVVTGILLVAVLGLAGCSRLGAVGVAPVSVSSVPPSPTMATSGTPAVDPTRAAAALAHIRADLDAANSATSGAGSDVEAAEDSAATKDAP